MVKVCRNCKKEHPLEVYSIQHSSPDGRGRVCPECKDKWRRNTNVNPRR